MLLKKAGTLTCFFCLALSGFAQGSRDWPTHPQHRLAYTHTLHLRMKEAHQTLTSEDPATWYIRSLGEAIEVLLTEDQATLPAYEELFEKRLQQLEQMDRSAEVLFVQAEIRLHWAFVYLKFGHEFDAAWQVRQAYLTAEACARRFPDFIPIKKTTGLLHLMLGAVPDKYSWLLSLLRMEGSVSEGIKHLKEVEMKCSVLSTEATVILALSQGFLFQETNQALHQFTSLAEADAKNPLMLFLASLAAVKHSASETALTLLNKLDATPSEVPLIYRFYVTGEVRLHRGDYAEAIDSYQKFARLYRGENYIKDAHYKTAICYWLQGNRDLVKEYLERAKNTGRDATEADRYAARSIQAPLPVPQLAKIRYATDGGYYARAEELIHTTSPADLPHLKDQVEFTYRKARLLHKTNRMAEAKTNYKATIDQSENEPWYYAPNACLQLGYIEEAEGHVKEAEMYYELALSYKRHEYKNSIDSKARSALHQLRKKQAKAVK